VKIPRASLQPLDFEGLEIRDYTPGHELSSSIAEISVEAGVRHRLSRSNRSDKYYLVLDGMLWFVVDGKHMVLEKGDCCIVPVGVQFRYENRSDRTARVLLVHTPSFDLSQEKFSND
jgi:mannose-6-phosphate isomerase-like protein (cupin superfamily)